jgi:hypothetical protein
LNRIARPADAALQRLPAEVLQMPSKFRGDMARLTAPVVPRPCVREAGAPAAMRKLEPLRPEIPRKLKGLA